MLKKVKQRIIYEKHIYLVLITDYIYKSEIHCMIIFTNHILILFIIYAVSNSSLISF